MRNFAKVSLGIVFGICLGFPTEIHLGVLLGMFLRVPLESFLGAPDGIHLGITPAIYPVVQLEIPAEVLPEITL